MILKTAVGIDLGTTNTVAAKVNDAGHTEVLRDREGDFLIPSMVLLDQHRTVIGEEARLYGRRRPSCFAACPKRDIGQPYYHQELDGVRLPPEVLQACILNKVRASMLGELGEGAGVVIAVPAHFNEAQRQATAAAGEMAGLNVIELVSEPLAAAVAYSEHTMWFDPAFSASTVVRLLVFDLGGYTFEASLIEIVDGTIRTVATDHLPDLGGHDWDLRIADKIAAYFMREHGQDPRETPIGLDALLQLAIRAKLALTLRSHTHVKLSHNGKTSDLNLTRLEFENFSSDLLESALALCKSLMESAGWQADDITSVFLVGGATRMPMISEALRREFGKDPENRISADEVIARGAAFFAATRLQVAAATGRIPHFVLANVSTHSLGIEGVDPLTGSKTNKIILPRGTPLPAKVIKNFVTRQDNQRSIIINILEGESQDPKKCILVGRVALRDLPEGMTNGWPVEVTCSYSAQGRISVEARLRYTDREAHLETARVGSVSDAHRARWKQVVTAEAGFAQYQEVDRWIRRANSPPPAVVVSTPEQVPATEELKLTSFLRRLMPFAFPPPTPSPDTDSSL
jgi:molecular chaperone DnaK